MIPKVAIHVSELTQNLEALPATPPTPTGGDTSGMQWWYTSWHYFVMHESLKEALSSDGTPFVEVSDGAIGTGGLLEGGSPKYPIVISLASEAVDDSEVAPLRDYVQAGGFLFVGSSAFTRRPDGTTRGDFALADEMGLHMGNPSLENWYQNKSFQKIVDEHRLVSHIPPGLLTWHMPLTAEQISWGTAGGQIHVAHFVWQVNAADAEVIANGKMDSEDVPLLATKICGEGRFIYHGALQPLIGHGGYDNGMYSYVIYRRAIEWAFEAADVPIVKLSPWRYPYDAAFVVRHDFENTPSLILSIEPSTRFEHDAGAKGDYYFCTGVIREGSEDNQLSEDEKKAARESVNRAVEESGATIGSHNGGLPNPVQRYNPTDYQYWHWGPDEALDTNPPGHPNGKEYAQESIRISFEDLEGWLAERPRVWVSPFFNSTRANSYEILQQLGVRTVGEQKLGVFPHRTVSTRTRGLCNHLTLPVSEWYVGTEVAQAMDDLPPDLRASSGYKEISALRAAVVNLHSPTSLEAAVDFYYDLGAMINIYSHLPSNPPEGAQDEGLPQRYLTYNLSKPGMWATNAIGVSDWWSKRSNVTVEPSYSMLGSEGIVQRQNHRRDRSRDGRGGRLAEPDQRQRRSVPQRGDGRSVQLPPHRLRCEGASRHNRLRSGGAVHAAANLDADGLGRRPRTDAVVGCHAFRLVDGH